MYTYRQPFPALTLQYQGAVMSLSFTADPPYTDTAPATIPGIPYVPGGGVVVTVPDDFVGHLTFRRQSDDKYLAQVAFDYRENPYLAIDPELFSKLIQRIEEQVPGLGPVELIPALPLDMSDWLVLWADFYDLDTPVDGVAITFKIQGVAPFSTDGNRFERDGLYTFTSGKGYEIGGTVFPETPGRAWIVLPKSSALRDKFGQHNLAYRVDSAGAVVDRQEAIHERVVRLEAGGNLLTVLTDAAST